MRLLLMDGVRYYRAGYTVDVLCRRGRRSPFFLVVARCVAVLADDSAGFLTYYA